MEAIKAIHTRHSVRAFKDDPIEPQLLTMIVTDAQQTPRGQFTTMASLYCNRARTN